MWESDWSDLAYSINTRGNYNMIFLFLFERNKCELKVGNESMIHFWTLCNKSCDNLVYTLVTINIYFENLYYIIK